jgi:cell division protein FtsB
MAQIFIKTSNKSKDYNWFNAENNKLESPTTLDGFTNLADTEFESLVLYRKLNELYLAITALKSNRIDNRTRPIRNSLIWIASKDEEPKIRAIIVEYLTNKEELEKQIAVAITETPEIKIDYQKIQIIGNKNNLESKALDSSKLVYKIGNLDKYKQELITEIKTNTLPKDEGLLIFITDSKSQKTFEEEKPWRGLSNKIPSGGWITVGSEKKSNQIFSNNYSQKKLPANTKASQTSNQLNFLSIILVILFVISVFLVDQNIQLNQSVNQLKQDINELKQNIEKIEKLLEVIESSKADVETPKTNLENDVLTAPTPSI